MMPSVEELIPWENEKTPECLCTVPLPADIISRRLKDAKLPLPLQKKDPTPQDSQDEEKWGWLCIFPKCLFRAETREEMDNHCQTMKHLLKQNAVHLRMIHHSKAYVQVGVDVKRVDCGLEKEGFSAVMGRCYCGKEDVFLFTLSQDHHNPTEKLHNFIPPNKGLLLLHTQDTKTSTSKGGKAKEAPSSSQPGFPAKSGTEAFTKPTTKAMGGKGSAGVGGSGGCCGSGGKVACKMENCQVLSSKGQWKGHVNKHMEPYWKCSVCKRHQSRSDDVKKHINSSGMDHKHAKVIKGLLTNDVIQTLWCVHSLGFCPRRSMQRDSMDDVICDESQRTLTRRSWREGPGSWWRCASGTRSRTSQGLHTN